MVAGGSMSLIFHNAYYYISLFMECFYICMRLSDLFERVSSVYHRFQFSGFNDLLQSNKSFEFLSAEPYTDTYFPLGFNKCFTG